MTVLLVLFFFATFLLIDYFRTPRTVGNRCCRLPQPSMTRLRHACSPRWSAASPSPRTALSPGSHLGIEREPQPGAGRHG